jgi:alpha-mannosidase
VPNIFKQKVSILIVFNKLVFEAVSLLDEILQSPFLDKILKFLDRKNFFYPGARIIGTIIRKILWKYKKDDYNFYAIGQSHLDAAWLWRRTATIRKNNVTFSNALHHMEDYPFFTFSCSSAQYYEWMETFFPEKFEKIKERVKEGRLELVGGMWIEPDLNCTSGESLVRQRLYGQRYYLEKFGKLSEIGWLTDCFGFNWGLPQILRKSGAKYFYTNKMSWNSETLFPFIIFHWQGPDGSKVLTYSMPYSLNLVINKPGVGDFKEYTSILKNIESDNLFNYESDYDAIIKRRTEEYIHDLGFVYGMGDGGGGPLRLEIIYLKDFLRHKLIKGFITMADYFKKVEKFADRLPIWNDEMYLEIHRGCYTSQVWLKKLNRKTEFDLYNLEVLASVASLFGWQNPRDRITQLWKILLFNQFHDILPGSSIPEVYNDTRMDFKNLARTMFIIWADARSEVLKQIKIPQHGMIIFNTLSWGRDSLISSGERQRYLIKTQDGTEIPSQVTEGNQIFILKGVPSIGYSYVSFEKTETLPEYETDLVATESETTITLENTYLRVEIDKGSGHVSRISHKVLDKEVLTAPGNRIQFYKEKMTPQNPAWNINPTYQKHPLRFEYALSVALKETGPVRLLVEVKRTSEDPSIEITQAISLLANTDRVDFHLAMKYYIKSTIVKLAFPFNVKTDKVHCEIPFATIDRSMKPKTPAQQAQWEIPGLKWLDVSQDDYGVTLINRSRNGFDARFHPKYKSLLRITILRIPVYPRAGNPIMSLFPSRKWHEQSEYSLDYSLYIHEGNWKAAKAFLPAYEVNNPPLTFEVEPNQGNLPQEFSFLQVEPPNVVLTALKLPEDKDASALILRVYEATGERTEATITFPNTLAITKAAETDLLELNAEEFITDKNTLQFSISPYEIKTFSIEYKTTL